MAVRCANCGEELLGAVNRCWRCGSDVLSTPEAHLAPPVRRTPLRTVPPEAQPPLAEGPALAPRPAAYRRPSPADAAAAAALLLGAAVLGAGGFIGWFLVLGLIGVAAGVWGLRSRWKTLAAVGLLVSCLGIAVSGVRLAHDAFVWVYGGRPVPAVPEPHWDDDFLDEFD